MNDIFHLIREGTTLNVRFWLDNVENNFNISDDHGFTLLHWACWDGRLDVVEMLVQRGAKINSVNNGEDTPLHCAVQNGHHEIVYYLIKHKATVNSTNLHGNTPLHYACHFAYRNIAFELINAGAFVSLCNRFGQCPIDYSKSPLTDELIKLAKSKDQDLTLIPYKDQSWRWSRTKNVDSSMSNQSGIDISEISTQNIIDSNHGGQTWKGTWQGLDIVFKILRKRETTQRIINNFNQEYKKLRIFNCSNILPVIGSCVNPPHLIILSHYMPYGSLFTVLHEQNDLVLDYVKSINIAIGIAKGFNFLHSLETPILNLPINSKHIMIDEDLTPKINMADYKFSFCDKGRIYSPAWCSPEALRRKPEEINKQASDMWSFSIILWEIYTKQIPFAAYSPMQCALMILNEGMRIELPTDMPNHLQKLIRICMNEDSSKRPKFDMILPILEKLIK